MISNSTNTQAIRRGLSMSGLAAAAMLMVSATAFAGQCPADKMGTDLTKPVTTAAKDVTDKVVASIDLAKEKVNLKDHLFRLRRLEIQPGGIVPWHSHGERPALIYIVSGEITEYASNCAVPIVHKAGDVAPEISVTAHWWKNTGTQTVVLFSADILHDQSDKNM